MNLRRWDIVVVALVCTGLGLATGWWADSRDHDVGHDHAPPPEPDDGHGHEHGPSFSAETLANLGVKVAAVEATTFTREQTIAAVVEETPFTDRPLRALVGGRVLEVLTAPGRVAAPGDPLVRIARAPIPLPELDVTADLMRPAHDEIHESIRSLRRARADERIARAELERIESFKSGDLPLFPGQRAIELQYDIERAENAFELARHELERHGLSEEQIDAAASGEHAPTFGPDNVRRALEHHGLWPASAERLLAALPEVARREPLAIATIGELGAKGLLESELVEWLSDDTEAARRLVSIGALLLRGHGLADVRRMAEADALGAIIEVRAPDGAPDWDVATIAVLPGAEVTPADPLVVLRDPRKLRLRILPLGGEVAALERAVAERLPCRATPAIPGTGPVLEDLRVDFVTAVGEGRSHAFADVDNEPIPTPADRETFRTWSVREGTAYELRVPIGVIEEAIVLPRRAVLQEGGGRFVLVPHDDSFEEQEVVVAFENADVAVLRSGVEPGTQVVVAGAFELSLALHGDEGGGGHHHHGH